MVITGCRARVFFERGDIDDEWCERNPGVGMKNSPPIAADITAAIEEVGGLPRSPLACVAVIEIHPRWLYRLGSPLAESGPLGIIDTFGIRVHGENSITSQKFWCDLRGRDGEWIGYLADTGIYLLDRGAHGGASR